MSQPVFYVHVQARACTARVRLNDAPVFGWERGYPTQAFPTISEWVIAGDNELCVDLLEADEGARLRVALCQAQLGDVPDPDAQLELAVIEWPSLPAPTPEGEEPPAFVPPVLPLTLRELAAANPPWGPWSWQNSPVFDATPQTTADVIAYVRDLHAALSAGRADILADQSQLKFDEVAPIYAMDTGEARLRLERAYAYLAGQSGWRLAPFDEQDVELRLRCDGRLVEPRTLDGQPILRQARAIAGESWSMPIFIARTHWEYTAGELTIVR